MHGDGLDLLVGTAKAELRRNAGAPRGRGARSGLSRCRRRLRIRRGIPRFPVDLDEDSLPAEADLEPTIDFTKGCFLGQESVAKVRNLGHPPRVVLALRSEEPTSAGEPVLAGGDEVGVVTSSTTIQHGSALLARVRWAARDRICSGSPGPRCDRPEAAEVMRLLRRKRHFKTSVAPNRLISIVQPTRDGLPADRTGFPIRTRQESAK